ncbi:MAG: hypothetical protein R3B96_08035 [Pirellulaceae bacterium]
MMDQPASDRPTGYLRPHDAFACGHEQGCRPGPTARGECCAQDDCAPVRVESRWVCRRSVARGGPCESGPGPNGECGVPGRKCQPRMSLRVKRARLVIISLGIVIALMSLALGSSFSGAFLARDRFARLMRRCCKRKQV